jgi:hypothetical protein
MKYIGAYLAIFLGWGLWEHFTIVGFVWFCIALTLIWLGYK